MFLWYSWLIVQLFGVSIKMYMLMSTKKELDENCLGVSRIQNSYFI